MKYQKTNFTPQKTNCKLPDLPKEGQFVIIWKYNNEIWSDVYRWKGRQFQRYSRKNDQFKDTELKHEGFYTNPRKIIKTL